MGVGFAPEPPWEWQDSRVSLRNGGLPSIDWQSPPALSKSYSRTSLGKHTDSIARRPHAPLRTFMLASGPLVQFFPSRQESL